MLGRLREQLSEPCAVPIVRLQQAIDEHLTSSGQRRVDVVANIDAVLRVMDDAIVEPWLLRHSPVECERLKKDVTRTEYDAACQCESGGCTLLVD